MIFACGGRLLPHPDASCGGGRPCRGAIRRGHLPQDWPSGNGSNYVALAALTPCQVFRHQSVHHVLAVKLARGSVLQHAGGSSTLRRPLRDSIRDSRDHRALSRALEPRRYRGTTRRPIAASYRCTFNSAKASTSVMAASRVGQGLICQSRLLGKKHETSGDHSPSVAALCPRVGLDARH